MSDDAVINLEWCVITVTVVGRVSIEVLFLTTFVTCQLSDRFPGEAGLGDCRPDCEGLTTVTPRGRGGRETSVRGTGPARPQLSVIF